MSKLYLIDGMSHIYRAYYAIKGLTNRDGAPTNAAYGFTVMLRKLIEEESPDYLGVALDPGGPTVRHDRYAEYKATRPKMPADLAEQIPVIRDICDAFRIPVLSCEKHEADDVIGTLARQAKEKGIEVVIVTIDKDLLQLVDESTVVLDTRSMTRLDSAKVREKWSVNPDQLVDVLSLVGDSSDNIPGAPGIGEKGARALINEYGSLENLLERAGDVDRKSYRESLQNNQDLIMLSRELVEIQQDLPIGLDLEALRVNEPDREAIYQLFFELNFTSMLSDFESSDRAAPPVSCEMVVTATQLEPLLAELKGKRVAAALWYAEGGMPEGVALCCERGRALFLGGDLLTEPRLVTSVFEVSAEYVLHDLKPLMLWADSVQLSTPASFLDTMLMAYLIDPNRRDFSLKQVGLEYLGRRLDSEQVQGSLLGDERPQQLAESADLILELAEVLDQEVDVLGLRDLLLQVEIPLVRVLAQMENVGVRVDTGFLRRMSGELQVEIERLESELYSLAGEEFNLNSPRQLSHILFEKLNLPSRKKTGKAGHYSTGVEVLEELALSYPIAQLILDYRELAKLKSTYLEALPKMVRAESGRIHTDYNQMVAATGRLSSSNPNLQNIPIRSEIGRRVRQAFVPDAGFLILAADYSQIELRVLAHLSADPVLVDAFRKGEDIHERTAREVFGSDAAMDPRERRRRAKVINFGIIYGLSAFGLAKSLKISRKEAQQFIDEYFQRYEGVKKWTEMTLADAENSSCVKTMFGRIRPVPEIASRNWNSREFARRTAINAPIQGTAADLIKMAMIAISDRLREEGLQSRIIIQVHDELVFEVDKSEVDHLQTLVREEMEGVAVLTVPLRIDLAIGDSWYYAK